MDRKKILIVGAGNLALHILQMLAFRNSYHLHVSSRNVEKAARLCNLVKLTQLQLQSLSSITPLQIDLSDVYRTADTLIRLRPDIIVNCASLQSMRPTGESASNDIDELQLAQVGPWLPMYLAPAYDLMRAVKLSGVRAITVNASFPEAVNAILDKAGLAPVIGIGTNSSLVPTVRMAIAKLAGCVPAEVDVKLVGKHYFSHYIPHVSLPRHSSYKLSYQVGGIECSGGYPDSEIFYSARMDFRYTDGAPGQSLTAASAVTIINNIFSVDEVETHVAGPNGLPGGYPVRIGQGKVVLSLPPGLSRNDAIAINHNCQSQDGIYSINADASVTFEQESMSMMESRLGFSMPTMKLQDVHQWSVELRRKCDAYFNRAKRPQRC